MVGIYSITNDLNGKIYIGQSSNIEQRWRDHKKDCRRKNLTNDLYVAMRTDGIEHFHFNVIRECLIEELNEYEKYYIQLYNSMNTGYNMTSGGDYGWNYSERSLQKMSESSKKEWERGIHDNLKFAIICNETQTEYASIGEAARQLGISNGNIVDILKGRKHSIKGLSFRYKNSPQEAKEFKGFSPNAKLNEQQVREIHDLLRQKIRQRDIAEMYNVSIYCISTIKNGKAYILPNVEYPIK